MPLSLKTTQLALFPKVYEFCHLTPETNTLFGRHETAQHAVSLSGGLASALAAKRVIECYGRENVLLWFADVRYEDEDLYRFLHDFMSMIGGRLYWYTDGRTPLQVAEERKLIPCDLVAPCSYELKVRPFREFIQAMPALPLVYIGYDPDETTRQCNTTASYAQAIPEARVDYPLTWEPQETRSLMQVCQQEWGIEPPRLYQLGFDYNNCGGRCCRNGIKAWVRLAYFLPDRFEACAAWEQKQRDKGGARANRSFAGRQVQGKKQSLPLYELREVYLPQAAKLLKLDQGTNASTRAKGKA
jgi:hypothetical protein